jgi:hypothetical protein
MDEAQFRISLAMTTAGLGLYSRLAASSRGLSGVTLVSASESFEVIESQAFQNGFEFSLVESSSSTKVKSIVNDIDDWLGEGAKCSYNKAGDLYIMSGTDDKKFRIDWNKTSPHNFKHMHIEVKTQNGNWRDAVKGKHTIGSW